MTEHDTPKPPITASRGLITPEQARGWSRLNELDQRVADSRRRREEMRERPLTYPV